MIENVGSIEYIASINTKNLKADSAKADAIAKTTGDNMGKSAEQGEKRASRALGALVRTAKVASIAVGVALGAAIVSNVDNAIKRVDTLNNSARTFENMGFTAKETGEAMKALDQSIRGLPTSLDSAVRGVQLLAGATNDVGQAQKIFTSLNNAVIGFGGNAEQVEGAIIQMSQAFSNGKVDAQTWNSLIQNGLGPALNALAREMGITTGKLKSGLSDGTISVKEFQKALIDMNEKGGGGMKSFEQIAKDATSGISTGWQNMQTAITRGIASIIQSIGSTNISTAISNFGSGFERVLKWVSTLIPQMVNLGKQVGEYLGPKLQTLWTSISGFLPTASAFLNTYLKPIASTLGTGLVIGIGLAIDALNLLIAVLKPTFDWLNRNQNIVWKVVAALGAYYAAMKLIALYTAFTSAINTAGNAMLLFRARVMVANTQMSIFKRLLGSSFVLNVAVGGALIAIGLVYDAAQKTLRVMDQLNASREGLSRSTTSAMEKSQQLLAAARKRGDKVSEKRILRSMKAIAGASSGYSSGGFTGRGGVNEIAGLVHKGEYVIPKDMVDQSTGVPSMGSKIEINLNMSGIMSRSKADLRDIGKDLIKVVNEELIAKGVQPIGGGAV